MYDVRLWTLKTNVSGSPVASMVNSASSTETESILEDVLVANPNLLEEGLRLIGRQLPTQNGPLDLVGIDRQGRLVVFELKRGTLTRDAVAQIIDYASDLNSMDRDDLARHIEERSGICGIEKIQDFGEWYEESFSDQDELSAPRMVLVGLGVDSRTKRMVQFLADAGLDIEVLTFHAFEEEGRKFIARQVEIADSPVRRSGKSSQSRKAVEEAVSEKIVQLGVHEFFTDMRDFIAEHLRITHGGSPGKKGVTFYKRAYADDPSGPGRAYVSLSLDTNQKGTVTLVFTFRAVREGGQVVSDFLASENGQKSTHFAQHYEQWEIGVQKKDWSRIREPLGTVLDAVYAGITAAEDAAESVVAV